MRVCVCVYNFTQVVSACDNNAYIHLLFIYFYFSDTSGTLLERIIDNRDSYDRYTSINTLSITLHIWDSEIPLHIKKKNYPSGQTMILLYFGTWAQNWGIKNKKCKCRRIYVAINTSQGDNRSLLEQKWFSSRINLPKFAYGFSHFILCLLFFHHFVDLYSFLVSLFFVFNRIKAEGNW